MGASIKTGIADVVSAFMVILRTVVKASVIEQGGIYVSPRAPKLFPSTLSCLSLHAGCCTLHGRNKQQGQGEKGARGSPGVYVEG